LEEESAKMADMCSRTEAAFVDSCKTIKEKEELLINIKENMEQEKDHLLYNFEKYREDLTDKMEKTSLRMEAITTEKNKLIESLHSKVQLLESSLMEKEEEVKQHAHCAEKHDELNSKIQTLALALAEKDKELSNCQRELNKERKLHAESNEQRIHAENELSDCQEELSNVKRAQAEDNERRHNAKKIAKALSSNVAKTRRRHHAIQREPRQDPPVSPHRNHVAHQPVYYERVRKTKSPRDRHSRRSETERYDNGSMSSIEYDSSDSIFDFSH
jgi:chromosome segregation ATPase